MSRIEPAPEPGAPAPGDPQSETGARGAGEPPAAEVQVTGGQVLVTLALPETAPDDLAHFVGSNLLLVWSRADPERSSTLIHLPVDVRQDTSVARFQNGVFDLTVLAADPATADRPRAPADVEHDGPGGPPFSDSTLDGSA